MTLHLHPDRLFPADPGVRSIARRLHGEIAELPIVSPHGHVDPAIFQGDQAFADPATLLVSPDHYVTRMLHACGVPLGRLRAGSEAAADPRAIWRIVCEHWWAFRGTPSRSWLEVALVDVFGVTLRPSADTADELYDQLSAILSRPEFRPRALYDRFRIEVLATTDDPCSDLAVHRDLAQDPGFPGRVIPTFRPDVYLDMSGESWTAAVTRLGATADQDTTTYAGFLAALEARRGVFAAHGATSSDHGHLDAGTEPLAVKEAARIYRDGLGGNATEAQRQAFRRHMLGEMARMSCDDGLVMQLHPGVLRNHHGPTAAEFGADTGHDIPVAVEFTRSLRPMLERYGRHPNFRVVLFTVDEDVWSRELAPLAGFYPSVYVGAPWWFLDTPDAMMRFRESVTDTAGFYRTSGFIDDTRAFCSIPARHDTARRIDCAFLARLVAEHRLPEDEAFEVARDLAYRLPKQVFRL